MNIKQFHLLLKTARTPMGHKLPKTESFRFIIPVEDFLLYIKIAFSFLLTMQKVVI